VETGTLPTAAPVPLDIPPGFWRRENTHCPKPMSPFMRGALPVVTECFRRAFGELGIVADRLEYREIGGWIYTGVVPLSGDDGAPDAELIRQRAQRAVETVRSDRFAAYVDRWPQWRAESIAGVERLRNVDLAALDDDGLVGHFNDIMEFSVPVFDLHFLLHCIGAMMLADLAYTCRELLGWDDGQALELLCGLSPASTQPAGALAELTAMARERPAVRSYIEGGEDDAAALWDLDPDFAVAFATYQERFGFRSIRYDIVDPSIEETPSMTLRLLGDQLRAGYDPDRRAAEAADRRGAAHARAIAALTGNPVSDIARFERTLERARRWYHVREDEAPMTFSEQFALIRRVALEIGRRLVASSLLDDPEDVFFLELPEALTALAARNTGAGPECRELVARRRAERAWVDAHPGPASYGTQPGTLPGLDGLPAEARFPTEAMLWLVERSGHFTAPANPQTAGASLTGIPVSAGTYTGPVRVLLGEADFAKLRPGDVLVCPITSPAWSVLFPNVGALVADAGGLMAHSAIIAREFQIPAVVATGNATTLLRDGQRVTVNGTAGSVEVVE
jgi:pyruvate,water dikinase